MAVKADYFLDAVRKGDAPSVRTMLEESPELVHAREVTGISAPMVALYNGHPGLAEELIERRGDPTFWEACALGLTDIVRRMLQEDSSLAGQFSQDGFPPLGLAVFYGRDEVARLLMDAGAPVNLISQNDLQVAAIHSAVARGRVDLVKQLLAHGADPNLPQRGGFRPLHGAAFDADREMAEVLLAAGADPGQLDQSSRPPSHIAIERGHAEFAEWLSSEAAKRHQHTEAQSLREYETKS